MLGPTALIGATMSIGIGGDATGQLEPGRRYWGVFAGRRTEAGAVPCPAAGT
jgi:hypothetical protein